MMGQREGPQNWELSMKDLSVLGVRHWSISSSRLYRSVYVIRSLASKYVIVVATIVEQVMCTRQEIAH